jgi:hypothetical protein
MIGGEANLRDQRHEITVAHIFGTQPEPTKEPEAASESIFDKYSDNGI